MKLRYSTQWYHTENRLNNIIFDNERLPKIIQSLDANNAHGYNGISIRMLKLNNPSIIKYFPRRLEKMKYPVHNKKQ